MINNFEKLGDSERDVHWRMKDTFSGKTIEVPGSAVNMPDDELVAVKVSAIGSGNGKHWITLIPKVWEEENPDKKFGSEAIHMDIEDPEAFMKEHGEE